MARLVSGLDWDLLEEDEREEVKERAAILEFDGGLSRRAAYEGAMAWLAGEMAEVALGLELGRRL